MGASLYFRCFPSIVTSILQQITSFIDENAFVRLTLTSPQLIYSIFLSICRRRDLTVQNILDKIERVLSDEEFVLDDEFKIDFLHIKPPLGGKKRQGYYNLKQFLQQKKPIIRIQNNDNIYCARAINTA